MTMQCSTPKSRPLALVLAVLVPLVAGCSAAAVEEPAGNNTPGGMMPMGTNPGNMMPGSMNPSSNPPGSNGGPASLKFCNAVGTAGGSLEMELVMGNLVLKAASGACAPSNSCSTVAPGTARLVFKTDGKEVYAQDVAIEAGQQYVVISTVDRTSQKIGLSGGKLRGGASCASENPFAGSSGPVGGGTAGKFCHSLSRQGGVPVEFELSVGNVKMTATTRGCSTPSGSMCQALPPGPTTASLSVEGQEITTAEITIDEGKEYLFGLSIDAAGAPSITHQALAAGMSCAAAGPPSGPAPPPGTNPPPSGMAEVKVCNRLPVMGNRNVAELDVGGAFTITTKPGECAPLKGTACRMLAAGTTTLALTLDGVDVGEADAPLPSGGVVLTLLPDAAGMPGIRIIPVPAGMMCSAFEPM